MILLGSGGMWTVCDLVGLSTGELTAGVALSVRLAGTARKRLSRQEKGGEAARWAQPHHVVGPRVYP